MRPLAFLGLDEFLVIIPNQVKAAKKSQPKGVQWRSLPQAPNPWSPAEPHRAAEAQEVMKGTGSGFDLVLSRGLSLLLLIICIFLFCF